MAEQANALTVNARFLTGVYHGRDRDGEPEWPPSPLRFFQALVAAAGGQRTEAEQEALRWLEQQPPPAIFAPKPRATGNRRKHFVPDNDADRQGDHIPSRIAKVFRPLHLHDGAEVQYRWAFTERDRQHASVIRQLAGRMRCLGWGIDVVAGRGGFNCAEPDGSQRWIAHPTGGLGGSGEPRRVPVNGTLESLDATHEAKASGFAGGQYRPTDANVTTSNVTYRPAGGLAERPWLAFSLTSIADGSAATFWSANVAQLAGQIRHAAKNAAGRCGWDQSMINAYVCGHDAPEEHRLAFLPLPSIGHPHADAMIRRALVVAPTGDEDPLRQLRARLIGALQPDHGEQTVALTPGSTADGVVRRYVGVARLWATVTPAILPGHISHRGRFGEPFTLDADDLAGNASTSVGKKAARVAVRLLEMSGVPHCMVSQITFTRVPPLANLPHAMGFRPPRKLERYQRAHVCLVLKAAEAGPLALGLGRFRGFGLLAAM